MSRQYYRFTRVNLCAKRYRRPSYLIFYENCPEAVEELKWCDDLTLDEY